MPGDCAEPLAIAIREVAGHRDFLLEVFPTWILSYLKQLLALHFDVNGLYLFFPLFRRT
jgi:hypothetical protein